MTLPIKSLFQESQDQNGFYVPHFEVRIDSAALPLRVVHDVVQLVYKDSLEAIDGFELTVNNFEATASSSRNGSDFRSHQFKYIGSEPDNYGEQNSSISREEQARYELFEPCAKTVEIKMGYGNTDNLVLMTKGNFVTMEANFPNGEKSTLSVTGLNVLHQLRRRQYSHAWTDRTDSDIANNLNTLRDRSTGQARFPVNIRTFPSGREEPSPFVLQNNQYDIDFLFVLARRNGYVVYMREADSARNIEEYLHFGTQEDQPPRFMYELVWGQSLMDFRPKITTANQIHQVTVRGWNRRRQTVVTGSANLDDVDSNRQSASGQLLRRCAAREEYVVEEAVRTTEQAERRARTILQRQLHMLVTCTARTIGLPRLRAGEQVVIRGIGGRLNGLYNVTETTHTIDVQGYTTEFKAERVYPQPTLPPPGGNL